MRFRSSLMGLLVTAWWVLPGLSSRAALSFDLNFSFSGTAPASSSQPWANVSMQSDGSGGVYLQVTTPNLTSGSSAFENIDMLYLNFNPGLNLNQLSFSRLFPMDNSITTSSIQVQSDHFKADGDGFYDIVLNFPTGQGTGTFGPNERLLYDIRSSGQVLQPSDFAFGSVHGGGAGQYYAAAHVQNTANGSGSAWIGAGAYSTVPDFIPIPEARATAFGAIGIGMVVLLFSKPRFRASTQSLY